MWYNRFPEERRKHPCFRLISYRGGGAHPITRGICGVAIAPWPTAHLPFGQTSYTPGTLDDMFFDQLFHILGWNRIGPEALFFIPISDLVL